MTDSPDDGRRERPSGAAARDVAVVRRRAARQRRIEVGNISHESCFLIFS